MSMHFGIVRYVGGVGGTSPSHPKNRRGVTPRVKRAGAVISHPRHLKYIIPSIFSYIPEYCVCQFHLAFCRAALCSECILIFRQPCRALPVCMHELMQQV